MGDRCARTGAGRPHRGGARGIEQHLATRPELRGSTVLYGGSAGPGLLTRGQGRIGGLFLGRFAHDPAAVEAILDEVAAG
ncbi:hypothetical protein [Curtobacterium sp. 24E2]